MAVKKIDIADPDGPSRLTCMLTGHSRSGKTRMLGTWPRPHILADGTEDGYKTLSYMGNTDFYELDFIPEVYLINSPADMMEAVGELEALARTNPERIGTIGIDSLTFYADMKFSEMEVSANAPKDKRQIYGDLGSHLRYLMIRVHKISPDINVVWTGLAKDGSDEDKLGGVLVSGQTATKAPARCDLWLYQEALEAKREIKYVTHFQTFGGYKAGHRFGTMLPASIDNCAYRDIETALQMTPFTERWAKAKEAEEKRAAKKAASK